MWLSLNEDNIVWPGGLKQKPTGLMIPTHLNVLTIEEKPFVYSRPLASGDSCDPNTEILCPHYNTEVENPIKSCKCHTQCGKTRNSLSTKVTYLVKPLISRNFCKKCMRENSRNFHTVPYLLFEHLTVNQP